MTPSDQDHVEVGVGALPSSPTLAPIDVPPLVSPIVGGEHTPARRGITNTLLLAFGIQILAAVVFIFWPWGKDALPQHLDALKDILTVTFGPTVTLLGSAMGFYFGRRGAE